MKKSLSSILLTLSVASFAQTELVFVFFKDKPNKNIFYSNPTSELTQKSIDRRAIKNIALNDQDAPIESSYIQNIRNLGFEVKDQSKWLNGVAVNATSSQITLLESQSYVSNVESFVKNAGGKLREIKINKFETTELQKNNFTYGDAAPQIDQINVRPLHVDGYTGQGVTVAIIDTGYPSVNTGLAFKRMRDNGQIKGGYNFVQKNNNIYGNDLNTHGTVCLGTMSGYLENQFVGSSPDADFYLYVSENAAEEIPEEELYWIQAAEEADRKGVDIITTSLGYTKFDDSRYDYTYENMNGTTSFIARGAQLATERGIFVSFAVGNDGSSSWHYMGTPADNAKVFSVGGVDSNGYSYTASSYGPNSAGAIKPDALARAVYTITVFNNSITGASGTSLATPLAAGGVASLMQAIPKSTPIDEISNRLREKSSLYPNYEDQKGFGILNFGNVLESFLSTENVKDKNGISISPNPVKNLLSITSIETIKSIEIYNMLGQIISKHQHNKINTDNLQKGNYLIKITTDKQTVIKKFIKN